MAKSYDLGAVTAYATAVEHGYEGTEEQFAAEMTGAAESARAAAQDASDAEAYAVGKRNGTDVPSTDPTYQNNAKYWAEHASGANLAQDFSTTANYSTNDYVLYNNKLYRFTTEHSAGAWNDAHVIEVKTMGEVSAIKDDLSSEVSAREAEFNTLCTVVIGKNKWNRDKAIQGYYINNGFMADDRFLSCIIAVNPGDKLVGSYKAPSGNTAIATIYSVGLYNGDTLTQTISVSANIYVVPSDITKIGVTIRSATYGENLQIEINSSGAFSAYEPYQETLTLQNNVVFPEISEARGDYASLDERLDAYDSEIETVKSYNKFTTFNLLDYSKAVDGYLNSNGEAGVNPATPSSTYITTDFIEAEKGDVLVASCLGSVYPKAIGTTIGYYAEYDADKQLLNYDTSGTPSKIVTNVSTKFVRLSIRQASYSKDLKVEKNNFGLFTTYVSYKPVQINKPVYAFMPQYIYCAVDRTIEVYNNQIMLDADNYHIQWVCNVGTGMGRKYVVNGTSAMLNARSDSGLTNGQYRLWFNAYDGNGQLIWQGCSILCIVAQLSSVRTILPIGDSLTNWKRWEPEIMNLSGQRITLVGTRYSGLDHDASGSEYESGTIHHEGRSGWSADSYLHNTEYTFDDRYDGAQGVAGTANPFWDGDKFSLSHYLTTQSKSVPDAVQIWLGTNDLGDGVATATENILSIVESIQSEYPTLKILLCSTIYKSRQDGYGRTGGQGYVANAGALAYQLEEDAEVMELTRNLAETLYGEDNIYIIPLYCSHDSVYNFGWIEVSVNPRAEQKTHIPEEAIHPAEQGYYQIADILYSAYSAILK